MVLVHLRKKFPISSVSVEGHRQSESVGQGQLFECFFFQRGNLQIRKGTVSGDLELQEHSRGDPVCQPFFGGDPGGHSAGGGGTLVDTLVDTRPLFCPGACDSSTGASHCCTGAKLEGGVRKVSCQHSGVAPPFFGSAWGGSRQKGGGGRESCLGTSEAHVLVLGPRGAGGRGRHPCGAVFLGESYFSICSFLLPGVEGGCFEVSSHGDLVDEGSGVGWPGTSHGQGQWHWFWSTYKA